MPCSLRLSITTAINYNVFALKICQSSNSNEHYFSISSQRWGSNPSSNSIWRCPDHHSFHIIYSFVFYEWKLVHAFRGGSRLVELCKRRKPISFLKYRTAKAKNITNILVVSGVQIWTAIPAILSKTRAESWRHMFLPSRAILVHPETAGIWTSRASSCIALSQI